MGKVTGFIIAVISGILIAKVLGPISAKTLLEMDPARQEHQQSQPLAALRESSLQDIIHGDVTEVKKGLPRMVEDHIRVISAEEAQSQTIYTYELIGVSPSAVDLSIIQGMKQEIVTKFRSSACNNENILSLLQRGMTIAQIYRFSETNQSIFTLVLSIRDC